MNSETASTATRVEPIVMPGVRRLKVRLSLKKARDDVDRAVDNNLGYCPDGEWFRQLERELEKWEGAAKDEYPDIWAKHRDKYY